MSRSARACWSGCQGRRVYVARQHPGSTIPKSHPRRTRSPPRLTTDPQREGRAEWRPGSPPDGRIFRPTKALQRALASTGIARRRATSSSRASGQPSAAAGQFDPEYHSRSTRHCTHLDEGSIRTRSASTSGRVLVFQGRGAVEPDRGCSSRHPARLHDVRPADGAGSASGLNTATIGASLQADELGRIRWANWLPVGPRRHRARRCPTGSTLTPDGMVWFSRLHTDEIGSIDPGSGKITDVQ